VTFLRFAASRYFFAVLLVFTGPALLGTKLTVIFIVKDSDRLRLNENGRPRVHRMHLFERLRIASSLHFAIDPGIQMDQCSGHYKCLETFRKQIRHQANRKNNDDVKERQS